MANDTRAKRETRDDKSSKGKQIDDKASTSSPAATPDKSGLRRSARETLSKLKRKSSSQKSKRLGKQNPATTPGRKPDRIETAKNGSPLRRSNRSKVISSVVSGSKKSYKSSDLPNIKRSSEKEKKEKSVKELASQTEDVNKNKRTDEGTVTFSQEKTDAHQDFFMKQEKRKNETDQDFVARETSEGAEKVVLENIQDHISADLTPNGGIRDNDVGKKTGIMCFKRKRGTADTNTSVVDAVISFPSNCKSRDSVEAHNACFKKQRGELKSGFTTRDGEKPNNDLPENGFSEDFQLNFDVNLIGKDSLQISSNDHTGNLKERFAKHIDHECKSESSRFIEYWVPVQISSVQLEQYCAALLQNSLSLCALSKSDPVGARCNTLISTRKCCDHPYLVDQSLQAVLTKDLKPIEYLDVGIKASGKLQLLEAMLLETKKQGFKALVLFQSIGGSWRDAFGDILEDFLGQRFGQDSYERIDSGLLYSKKQSALNRFNKEKGRFVLLMETRACQSSIKFSAIDFVIVFNSDWNPMNDLKALQRISLDSEVENIMIFRLYSSFTVEEMILILAKQDKILDSNIQSISPGAIQTLLMWGASYLFDKLKEFHGGTSPAFNTFDQSHMDCVLREFLIVLTQNRKGCDSSKLSLLLHANHQVTYRTDFLLFGEQKIQVMNEDPPHTFWTKLLNDKHPQWKYFSNLSPKNRKRVPVQHFDYSPKKPEFESGNHVKKHKKVVGDSVDSTSHKTGSEGQVAGRSKEEIAETLVPTGGTTALVNDKIQSNRDLNSAHHEASCISKLPEDNMVESDEWRQFIDSQQNLLALLKPDVARLSEVLHLPDNVRAMVESFLEYIMNNHLIDREPETRLQAFQISLCWTSAALMKHKISHKESLALAKQHLNFGCSKEEAEYVYSLLQCLKKMFLYRTGIWEVHNHQPNASDLSTKCLGTEHLPAAPNQHGMNLGVDDLLKVSQSSENYALSQSKLALEYKLALADLQKSIKDIQTTCDKQMKNVILKQREEMEELKRAYEEEKAQLGKKKKTEEAVIRLHRTAMTRSETLKKLDDEYQMKIVELNKKMDIRLKNLEAMQVEMRNKVLQRKGMWIESVRSWAWKEFRFSECNTLISPSHEKKHAVLKVSSSREQVLVGGVPDGVFGQAIPGSLRDSLGSASSVGCFPEDWHFNIPMPNSSDSNGVPEIVISANECTLNLADEEVPLGAAKTSSCREQVLDECTLNQADEEVPLGASQAFSGTEGHRNTSGSYSLSKNQKPDGAPSTIACQEAFVNVSDGLRNTLPMNSSLLKAQITEVSGSCVPEEIPLTDPETTAGDLREGDKLSMRPSLNVLDVEAPISTHEIVSSDGALDHVVSLDPSLEQLPSASVSCIPDQKFHMPESNFASKEVQNGENSDIGDNLPIKKLLSLPVGKVEANTSEVVVTCCDCGFQTVYSVNPPTEEENPDAATSSTSDREVPLLELESAPGKVALESGNTKKKGSHGDHASSHEKVHLNDGLQNIDSSNPPTGEKSREVAASGVSNREDQFLGSDSASSEVLGSGNASGENDRVNQASTPVIVSCNVDKQNDGSVNPPPSKDNMEVVGLCMPKSSKDVPQSERESATREVPEGRGNANRENGAAIQVDQLDSVVCSVSQGPQLQKAALVDSLRVQPIPTSSQGCSMPLNRVETHGQTLPSTGPEMQARDAENTRTQRSSEAEHLPSQSTLNLTPSQNSVVTELGAQVQPSSMRVSPSSGNQLDLPLTSRVESSQPPSHEGLLSQATRYVSETRAVPTHRPILPVPPAVSSSYTLMPCHDPLQNEMERLNKESEQSMKIHEEMKLQLKTDCDKEIEETVAQVRKKYEIKLKEADAEYLLKKKQLDANHHKVLMNKILAEAFRLKVIDNYFTGMPPEMGSNFMQQLAQLSPEQMAQRPSSIPGTTGASLPANIIPTTSVQTASPSVISTPAMRSPSLQTAHIPPVTFSATSPRPPPCNGNFPVGSENSAPLPYPNSFRPSTSPSPNIPPSTRVLPSQLGQGNSLPPRTPVVGSQPGRALIPSTSGASPALPNPSALDLLINAANQSLVNPNPPSNLSSSISPNVTRPGTSSNPLQPPGAAAPDVVCLSDDD